MNRYELHLKLSEAEKKGYQRGRDETLRTAGMVNRATSHAYNLDPNLTGKYRCKVEWVQMPTMAAYELRVTLVVGRKFYNAKQVIDYMMWANVNETRDRFKTYLNSWLDGAYKAMWAEFKKDVVFEFPNLDEAAQAAPVRDVATLRYDGIRWEPQAAHADEADVPF